MTIELSAAAAAAGRRPAGRAACRRAAPEGRALRVVLHLSRAARGRARCADQDAVAVAAGARAAAGRTTTTWRRCRRASRAGATTAWQLPVIDDGDLAGTSAAGLVRAVAELSGGSARGDPGRRAVGGRDGHRMLRIAPAEQRGRVVLNIGHRRCSGARGRRCRPARAIWTTGDDSGGPPAEWQVGHFTGCWGAIRGQRRHAGRDRRHLSRRWVGTACHLQPIERVAASLRRDGHAHPGGALVIVPSRARRGRLARAGGAGLHHRGLGQRQPGRARRLTLATAAA